MTIQLPRRDLLKRASGHANPQTGAAMNDVSLLVWSPLAGVYWMQQFHDKDRVVV
ncbi:hypothetical protein [Caballeronia sordidicola]|jgi:hypothetical protein|uniref:Uncharacterized protein n=1 Tax=Caballeronia sordidicola TaxID=196367 RepID=A0A226X2J6_CABSO|nr:hypothetical protein [Caballeronia sordidicola]OXC77686.1 hypothetical protein BSU04_15720 [Caballeronia sordidicola]